MSKQGKSKNNKMSPAQKGTRPQPKKKNSTPRPPTAKPQKSLAAAYATGSVGRSPKISANAKVSVISQRELVDNVHGNGNSFTVHDSYPINPGMSKTFPWLSTQAVGWEKYRFKKIRFLYLTRSGATDKGSIILSIDHDAADLPPASEQIACSYLGAAEDVVWKDISASVRCPSEFRYVRTQALGANLDIKTYDVGTLYMCSAGCSADSTFGKLFVEYEVEFTIPQLPAGPANVGGSVQGGGTMNAANPYGTVPVPNVNSAGINLSTNSLLTLQRAGTYLLNQTLQGTGITNAGSPNIVDGVATIANTGVINAGSTFADVKSEITVATAPAVINLANALAATTVTSAHLDVGLAPNGSL
jgi:hypothetical protein